MKYLTYRDSAGNTRAGVLLDEGRVADLTLLLHSSAVIRDIGELLDNYENADEAVRKALLLSEENNSAAVFEHGKKISLCAPILRPHTLRDFCAYEDHVKRCGKINGIGIPPKWYKVPLFFFQNTNNITGPDDVIYRKKNSVTLDYEAEIAFVIGKAGKDISPDQALKHIFGFMIFNDWSDRDRCTFEVGFLGLHKGKDTASGFGPYIVTVDELENNINAGKLNLKADAWVDDIHTTDSRTNDMHWTLAECIAYASEDTWLYPGDILGLGTISGGCIYEQTDKYPYLYDNAKVTVTVEKLGTLVQYVGQGEA